MVIVSILGGLGNQFNAYACGYIVAKELNQPLVLDISDYFAGYFRPFALEWCRIPNHLKLFFPKKNPAYSSAMGAPDKILLMCDSIINTDELHFDREKLLEKARGHRNVYIQGYGGLDFGTEQEQQELKILFQPRTSGRGILKQFCSKIEHQESVAIHIRRTDFVELNWWKDKELEYYKAAIEYMRQQLEQPQFYFFSDDIEWAKENLGNAADYHYINILGGIEADVEELYCISACRHRILTKQSSYGWWAAKLSPHKDGMNITTKEDVLKGIDNRIDLTEEEIGRLSGRYTVTLPDKKNIDGFLKSMEEGIMEGRNQDVIESIDNLSFGAWDLTEQVKRKLLEYKGIAYLQMEGGEQTALAILDKLQQFNRDEYDFSFNYAIALAKAGKRLESILYAANAVRISGNEDITRILDIDNGKEHEILELISAQKRRHYIFLDANGYNNVYDYYHSLGVMLRNLGNRVTFLRLCSESIDIGNYSTENIRKAVDVILQDPKEDFVYQHGIAHYRLGILEAEGKLYSAVSCVAERLRDEAEETVMVAHSQEEIGFADVDGEYPMIFLDAFSEWDVNKYFVAEYKESDWEKICRAAARILTIRNMPEAYRDKAVKPFPNACRQKADDLLYVEERILFTDHYMKNEELLWGVLSLVKAAEALPYQA